MNIVSIILILVIGFSIINGIARGFVLSLAGLLSWIGSLILTLFLYPHVARLLLNVMNEGTWVMPLSIFLCLIVSGVLFSYLFNLFLVNIPVEVHENRLNKIAGLLPGAVNGLLYAALLSLVLLTLPITDGVVNTTRDSGIAQYLTLQIEKVEEGMKPELKQAINRTMQMTIIEEGSKEKIQLPFSVSDPKVRETLEAEMLTLINEERAKEGLNALVADTLLREVARMHSRDMFARSYFSHVSPDGHTPFDRIKQADISFRTAGENLALAQTLAIAHQGLMDSPGHRANILKESFGRVGIGILDGGIYGLMVTQNFRN